MGFFENDSNGEYYIETINILNIKIINKTIKQSIVYSPIREYDTVSLLDRCY